MGSLLGIGLRSDAAGGGISAALVERVDLVCHPDSPSDAVTRIIVEIERSDRLRLCFRMTGRAADVVFPPVGEAIRADGLWQTTCFEAFVKPAGGACYREYNFAPSRCWAAYWFDGYRSGMAEIASVPPLNITSEFSATGYELRVELPLDRACALGLSAVIEEVGGVKSYWALAHPPGKPDFHHGDCFALQVAAPGAA